MLVTSNDSKVALVIDVEGTRLRSSLLWEGCLDTVLRNPGRLPDIAKALLRGRAALDAAVLEATLARGEVTSSVGGTIELMRRAKTAGRPVVLVSTSRGDLVHALAGRIGAELLLAPPGDPSGDRDEKLARIRECYDVFDYIGGDPRHPGDVPVWKAAREAYTLSPGTAGVWQQVKPQAGKDPADPWPWRAVLRSLRPHQWVKNTLLFLPAMAAHLPAFVETIPSLAAGFVAFCGVSSATYILNDLIDLPSDRVHATKRTRPLASGELAIPTAVALAVGLTLFSMLLALALPLQFQIVLAAYLVLTVAYSLALKKRPILDVITLATLYTARVVAGAALVGVSLSRWFLAFSVFFFFSLALLKRVIELTRYPAGNEKRVPGRGYRAADLPVLTSLGTTAVMASALVYCLYITSAEIGQLYDQPDVLWLGLPILLFWQSRLWLFVGRGAVHDDPVVYALKDRVSRAALVLFLLVVWVAA